VFSPSKILVFQFSHEIYIKKSRQKYSHKILRNFVETYTFRPRNFEESIIKFVFQVYLEAGAVAGVSAAPLVERQPQL
jgi:hypothetical protein